MMCTIGIASNPPSAMGMRSFQLSLGFIVDSGASDVSIPEDVFSTIKRTGTIQDQETDLLGNATYELADGSTHTQRAFHIRSLRIGSLELRDVVATVSPAGSSLLLGQSFLRRLSSWSWDNQKHLLLINEIAGPQDTSVGLPAVVREDTASATKAAPTIPEPAPTKFEEISSHWPRRGESAFVDISHITYEFGHIRRTWIWFMKGPDAKQDTLGPAGRELSYRYLISIDCNARRIRVEEQVNQYEKQELTWSAEQLSKRQRSWARVWSDQDYEDNATKLVCTR